MKVAVLFENLGPYHVARLDAMPESLEVIAIERRQTSIEYKWSNELRPKCRSFQLFSNEEKNDGWKYLKEKLHTLLQVEQPDMLFLNGWADPMSFAALRWSLPAKRPTIIMSDSSLHDKPRSKLKEIIKSHILRLFDGYLAAGSSHVEYLRILGATDDKIASGFDAVDNDYYSLQAADARTKAEQVREELDLPEHYFLTSARFVEKKNLLRLIEGYAHYAREALDGKECPRHLVLLGDGPLKSEVDALVAKYGLANLVRLPGFKQYDVLPKYYALADGFILASTEEQWGLVVNEAMACSIPIALSDRCGCAPDLLQNEQNGFSLNPFDVESIKRAFERLSKLDEDERQRFGARSCEIISNWGPQRFHDGVEQLVTRISKRGGFKKTFLRSVSSLVLNWLL